MIKVKLNAWWTTSEACTQRLLNQFYTGVENLQGISFVHADSYDYAFFCNYINEEVSTSCKNTYIFVMEPSWSGNIQKHNHDINATIFAQNKHIFTAPEKVVVCPQYMFYGGRGEESWTYKNIVLAEHIKTENISSVVSTWENQGRYGDLCIYDDRVNLIKQILKNQLPIDVYGWDHENAKGGLREKINGLSKYRFSLAVESCHEPNYITEKFYDCIITNTIPIYYGATNIEQVFPDGGFFNLSDIKNTDHLQCIIEQINNNPEEVYNQMLPNLLKTKNKFFREINPLQKIIDIVTTNENNSILQ